MRNSARLDLDTVSGSAPSSVELAESESQLGIGGNYVLGCCLYHPLGVAKMNFSGKKLWENKITSMG